MVSGYCQSRFHASFAVSCVLPLFRRFRLADPEPVTRKGPCLDTPPSIRQGVFDRNAALDCGCEDGMATEDDEVEVKSMLCVRVDVC